MKHNNLKIQESILAALKKNYHIDSDTISFIPVGEDSYGYKIKAKEKTFFVKYCEKTAIIKNI